ncbi:MAG: acyl carrier protein [Oligoflexia bacterium]|nr:acyl carrier protein [Oligoflexia bacterium]
MDQELVRRITPIFRQVLDTPDLVLTRELDATLVPNWDSLNHISLIIALEEELGLEFDTEELVGLANVGEMVDFISKKLKVRNGK